MLDIYDLESASRYCIIKMLVAVMLYVDTSMLTDEHYDVRAVCRDSSLA